MTNSTDVLIGPNPCPECGGEYGDCEPDCSRRKKETTPPVDALGLRTPWRVVLDERYRSDMMYSIFDCDDEEVLTMVGEDYLQFVCDAVNAHASQVERIGKLESALQVIVDDERECGCLHDNENCCAIVGEHCPYCIAAVALANDATTAQKEDRDAAI